MLCSLENLQLALDSHVAKGNLVRQLKQWRRNGSPTYEAAFGLGVTVCAIYQRTIWLAGKGWTVSEVQAILVAQEVTPPEAFLAGSANPAGDPIHEH